METTLGRVETINDFDNVLWSDELERGEDYDFEIMYMDGHVEIGKLRYIRPVVSPIPIPGSNEHLVIAEYLTLSANTDGLAKYIRRIR